MGRDGGVGMCVKGGWRWWGGDVCEGWLEMGRENLQPITGLPALHSLTEAASPDSS